MSQKINLSDKQREIVLVEDGPIYVKASAGSGKTRVLTERIGNLLGKTKRKILALTFTNKAAKEMKERLPNFADINKRLFVGTFHGFCQYVLENHGNLIGLPKAPHIFEEESDRIKLIEQAIEQTPSYSNDYKNQNKKEQQKFCYKVLSFISQVKRECMLEEELLNKNKNENFVMLFKTYQDILVSQNAIDFDDLLLLVYKLFIQNPETASLYRRTYQYICVDEAQDLNNAQYQVVLALTNGKHKNVMMVGDPNQSIFGFNGSSPDFMNKSFVEDFKPKIFELKENYRSSQAVLKAAEKLIPSSNDVVNTVIKGIFEIHKANNEEGEAGWICDKINEFIQQGKHSDIEGDITFEKIAILARNKYVFNKLEETLNERGIPFYYKMTPGGIKFESEAINIFDLAFRIKLNPQDNLHCRRLCELLEIKYDKTISLSGLILKVDSEIKNQVLKTVNNLANDGRNVKVTLEKLKNFMKNKDLKLDDNEVRMILNDIDEILKHWFNYAKMTDKKSLQQFKNAMALGQTHPLTQYNGVTLSTVHTMKGQEFDIIILMGVDDETFPDYRAIRSGGVEMVQEKNNLYVAFTRAKRFLFAVWPQKRLMPWGDSKDRKISRFLENFTL
ncbi:MAG: ATP-dependent helicase [Candidatus Saelkia tenebricola]|nr:ATP-dependent helicase [Candidatus Saelkia tenebricola]